MVHKSDISWTAKVNNPADLYQKGDDVEAIILSINHDEKKVSPRRQAALGRPVADDLQRAAPGQGREGEGRSASSTTASSCACATASRGSSRRTSSSRRRTRTGEDKPLRDRRRGRGRDRQHRLAGASPHAVDAHRRGRGATGRRPRRSARPRVEGAEEERRRRGKPAAPSGSSSSRSSATSSPSTRRTTRRTKKRRTTSSLVASNRATPRALPSARRRRFVGIVLGCGA